MHIRNQSFEARCECVPKALNRNHAADEVVLRDDRKVGTAVWLEGS
jgi:hypothetical protein